MSDKIGSQKSEFRSKIRILVKNRNFSQKIEIFVKICHFGEKLECWTTNEIFVKNWSFSQKSKFFRLNILSKYVIDNFVFYPEKRR